MDLPLEPMTSVRQWQDGLESISSIPNPNLNANFDSPWTFPDDFDVLIAPNDDFVQHTVTVNTAPAFPVAVTPDAVIPGNTTSGLVSPIPPNPSQELGAQAVALRPKPNKRRWQPPDAEWNRHKDTIYDLYINKNFTLPKTVDVMREKYGFSASARMYKTRLKEWKITKNLKSEDALLLSEKLAMKDGQEAEAILSGHSTIPAHKLKKSIARHLTKRQTRGKSEQCETASSARKVAIPLRGPVMVPSPTLTARGSSFANTFNNMNPWETEVAHANWLLMPLDEIRQLKVEAVRCDQRGNAYEAEAKLREALHRFQHHSGPTHSNTVKTVYQLASFYSTKSRSDEAQRILEWALDCHISRWTLNHPRTITHLLHVVELLHSWSETDTAVRLLDTVLSSLQNLSETNPNLVTSPSESDDELETASQLDDSAITASSSSDWDEKMDKSRNEIQVDSHLRLETALLQFKKKQTMDDLLLRFINQCGRHDSLSVQALRGRITLLRYYDDLRRQHQEAQDAHEQGDIHPEQQRLRQKISEGLKETNLFWQRLVAKSHRQIPSGELLTASKDLAFLYHRLGDPWSCEKILEYVATKVEQNLSPEPRGDDRWALATINFLGQIGVRYRSMLTSGMGLETNAGVSCGTPGSDRPFDVEAAADRWFARAITLLERISGPKSSVMLQIEQTVKSKMPLNPVISSPQQQMGSEMEGVVFRPGG